jgi:pyruvate carboxylase subunit B
MILSSSPRKIRVMITTFRDGLQSSFGGKVRLEAILPAMEAAARAGVRHFESGGGARYQAPYFYGGEDPFACMDAMRRVVGTDADLQILTRSVSGVTLTTQRLAALALQAKLMRRHGTTWNRNFDYMNDVDNLVRTGEPIVASGMHHQVCVAMMGLPFEDPTVHSAEFYIDVVRKVLARGAHFDSVCMKDASGTTDPRTCYETAKGLKRILPPEVPLWQHTHDTASLAVAYQETADGGFIPAGSAEPVEDCYLAGIEAGVDGIDLSVRPMASGTVQPDVRSMWHALRGTGFTLDVDETHIHEVESLLLESLKDYEFDPLPLLQPGAGRERPRLPGPAVGQPRPAPAAERGGRGADRAPAHGHAAPRPPPPVRGHRRGGREPGDGGGGGGGARRADRRRGPVGDRAGGPTRPALDEAGRADPY